MKDFFAQLKNEAEKIRLTRSERELMRRALEEAIHTSRLIKSPIRITPSPYLFISSKLVAPMAFVLILAVVGGGTAYAAESAVPGDTLYPVKVNVNEKLAVALATTAEGKADVQAKLAERRMKEAEVLVERGTFTAETKVEIEARLEEHADRVDAEVAAIEPEDPIVAADITSRLGSALEAHSALIERLGEETRDEGSREESRRFASALRERGKRLARSGEGVSVMAARSAEGDIAVQTVMKSDKAAITATLSIPADDPVAIRIGESASSTLEEAETRLRAFEKNLNATTAERVKKQIERTKEQLKQLRGYDKKAYENALKDAQKLKVFIEAQEEFEKRDLLPALELEVEEEGEEVEIEIERALP
ncbi:hypothetical protein HY414_01505 [Candidatus Kaiserbacteria bacterium]|nr:hypothetical protein [Candidatus Kaiserbacteria bacterium]